VSSSGYICQFKDLQVRSLLLDEIMPQPEQPQLDCIIVTEAKVSSIVALTVIKLNCSVKFLTDHFIVRIEQSVCSASLCLNSNFRVK